MILVMVRKNSYGILWPVMGHQKVGVVQFIKGREGGERNLLDDLACLSQPWSIGFIEHKIKCEFTAAYLNAWQYASIVIIRIGLVILGNYI